MIRRTIPSNNRERMRAIVSTWKYLIIISNAFILGMVHQSTTYELKESAYCEWYCTKVQQQWDGSCHVYGSCRWYCQVKRKDCTPGTRYHCARDLHNKDLFIETCAPEIFCLAGEEPQISLQQSGKASVYCKPCYRRNMFNGRHNTSSAVFSECSTIKTNFSPDPAVASVYTTVTTVVEDKATNLFIERHPNKSRPNKRIFEVVVTGASLFIAVFIVLVFVKQKKDRRRKRQEIQSPIVRAKYSHDIPTAESDSEGLLGQKWCADLYRRLPQEGFIDIGAFEFDNLKDMAIIEPTSWPTIHAIHVDGYVPYAIHGKNITNLFELFSYLICKSDQLKFTLQCAAASFGIKYFGIFLKKLTEAFKQSKTQLIDAKIFFEIHGIYIKEFPLTEESVSGSLDKLLQEIVVTEITGPFHAELLSGVLDCNIIQHFENNRFYDRDVTTITGLNVYAESRQREQHIYWRKSAKNVHSFCLIPLFKKDDQTSSQNTNVSQVNQIEMDSRNYIGAKIAEQKSFHWRTYFKTFENSQNVVFDELKCIELLKPECVMKTVDVYGFEAYEKPSGKFCSVYELLSYLLCRENFLIFILRQAAARYAKTHFETYVTKLTNTFDNCFEANVFFKAHGITLNENMKWPKHKRECVSDAFDRLVREAVNEGKGNAPFYVEFLSGVLNRKIHQHFEGKTYDGRKVDTIAGLNVSLTTDDSSDRELHVYWMKSKDREKEMSYWIFPLFKCVQNGTGMELCEGIYAFLKNDDVFEENTCLDMINVSNLFEFDKLKEIDIIKPNTISMRTIKTIKVEGFTAYEMPDEEITCMYEFMSYLLFGNANMKYIMRLAAMRYALQNFGKYVNKLTCEFGTAEFFSSRVNGAKLFFEIHSIAFNKTESSPIEKCVRMSFTDLVREIVNTGQGPFYVEFLRGALNCKIRQFVDLGLYERRLSTIPGFNVTLTTSSPPERELHIYRMTTVRGGLSNNYKIVHLLKNVDCRKTAI